MTGMCVFLIEYRTSNIIFQVFEADEPIDGGSHILQVLKV